MRRALFLLLALAAWAQAAAAQEVRSEWQYTVRPGDNLWELAKRYCGSHHHALEIARYNRLADPTAVVAGERIRIPVSCLVRQPAAATIALGSEAAELRREGSVDGATAGREIRMGDVITTQDDFVVVQFADRSMLTIRPQSTVSFVLISAYGETGMVDTLVRVTRGRVQHVADKTAAGSRHRIATPVGIAAVRGTRYRVGVAGDAKVLVGTTEGEVAFEDVTATTQSLPAGTGLVATDEGSDTEPLLPAPQVSDTTLSADGTFRWSSVAGAQGYRVTALRQNEPVFEAVTNDAAVSISTLPRGSYVAQVRAIAASGLEGLDGEAQLEVVAPPPDGLKSAVAGDRSVSLVWDGTPGQQYAVQVRSAGADGWTSRTAEGGELRWTAEPGRYEWRVAAAGPSPLWSEPAGFDVAPRSVGALDVSRKDPKEPLKVAWESRDSAADSHIVEIASDEAFLQVVARESVTDAETTMQLERCSPCYVRVAAETQGVASEYTVARYEDPPGHPWPLYVLLAIIAIAL